MAAQPCPICSGERLEGSKAHRANGQQYTLFECLGCKTQHWQPLVAPPADYYEGEQQAMYADIHAGARRAGDDPRYARFLGDFGDLRGRKLLDIGCADGALMQAFRELGNDAVGVDIDSRSLALARARGLEVHEATLERFVQAHAAGRRFDVVTLFDVLEHLTAPRQTLELVRSMLAPGGRLVGTVPNRDRLFADQIHADFPPHHFLRFDRAALDSTLRECGLSPVRVDVFQWGYAGPTLMNAGVKRVKAALRRARSSAAASGAQATSGPGTPRRRLKHEIADAVMRVLARASTPVERAMGRGFKLYFVAEP